MLFEISRGIIKHNGLKVLRNEGLSVFGDFLSEDDLECLNLIREGKHEHNTIIVDGSSVFVYPGFFCQNKWFYTQINETFYVSDEIELIVGKISPKISIKGVSCFLANGNYLNGLTQYEDVYQIQFNTVVEFNDKYISTHTSFKADYRRENVTKTDFLKVINDSVTNLDVFNGDVLVTLSGGYDSRSLLYLLHSNRKTLGINRLIALTYRAQDSFVAGSDAATAADLAEIYADKFLSLSYEKDDLMDMIDANLMYGKGLAPFCDEILCYTALSKSFSPKAVVCGDEMWGRLNVPLEHDAELLDSVSIVGVNGLKSMKGYFTKFAVMRESLKSVLKDILYNTEEFVTQEEKRDYLYIAQRLVNVNFVWRERFTSIVAPVINPYINKSSWSLVMGLSDDYRTEKRYFKNVLREFFPELFKVPLAKDRRSLTGYNYLNYFKLNHQKIRNYILETDSQFEDVCSRRELIDYFENVVLQYEKKRSFRDYINATRRIIPASNVFLKYYGPRLVKTPAPDRLFLRLLILYKLFEKK